MKYTIEGFNQQEMFDMGLDCTDAIILRFIVDFYNTGKMTKVSNEGKEYFWLSYQNVIEQIPLIRIKSKIALARRIKKYSKCGLMESYTHKGGGTFSCFRFTDMYEKLIGSTQKLKGSIPKSLSPINSKVKTKDSSIINSSTKKNSSTNKIDIIVDENKKTFSSTLYFLFNKYFDQINGNIDSLIDSDYEDIPDIIIKHFCYYQYKFGKKHPSMKNEQMENVLEILEELFEVMGEKLFDEHIQYWQRNDIETDYNLNHFVKFVEGCPGLLNRV